MAANLQPITSDGGFTSGGNINSSGDPSAAPSLNDFFSITSAANFAIVTDNANTDQTWTFDDTGNLTLPLGSIVYETNIPDGALSGSAIALKPIGGTTANQQLLIYPTAADGDHIHMTSGNLYATELFLGSDNLYVKLANTGNVVINSNDGNSSNAMWTFGTDGSLTLPIGVSIDYNGNVQYPKIIADSGKLFSVQGQGNTGSAALAWTIDPNAASQYAAVAVTRAGGDDLAKVVLTAQANSGDSANAKTWTFNEAGNLTLPGNTFAVNYANGTQVSIGGGGNANTGNVTFSDQILIGTGSNDGSGGLYLAPGNNSIANSALQYLRVRGGDVVTHIHLDTGNNAFYDQYFGNDAKYVKLEAGDAGNVVIGTDDANGNQYSWSFTSDGNLILAGGDSVIQSIANSSLDPNNANVSTMVFTPDQNYTSQSLVIDPTGPSHIHLRAPGANIDEPDANIFLGGEDSSFEVGYYDGAAPNLFVHSGGNTWTFGTDGNLDTPSNLVIGPGAGSGSRIFQYDEGLEIVGEGANSVVAIGWTANASAPDGVASITMNYPNGGEGNVLIAVGNNATTVNYWLFDNTGNTTFPRNISPNTTDPILTVSGGATPTIRSDLFDLTGPANLAMSVDYLNLSGSTGNRIAIYADNGEIGTEANMVLYTNLADPGNIVSWILDTTGNLTLPDTTSVLANVSITLEANDTGNITGLNVIGDSHANLYAHGNVTIVSDSSNTTPTWTFGTDGNLTVPGSLINDTSIVLSAPAVFNICTIATAGSGYNTGSSLKATTGGSGTGMTVGIGYGLSNQLTSVSVVNPGTGYVNGDVITVSEGTGGTFVITKYNVLANQTNNNTVQTNLTFANNTLTLPIYGEMATNANMTLTTNLANAGNTSSWTFDNTGNLVLPGNTFAVNYANGTQVSLGGGNVTWSQIDDKSGNGGPTIITLGQNAGLDGQGNAAIAIGKNAGQGGQGDSSITIGEDAGGNTTQGANAVAIGRSAGFDAQGEYAVAIGHNAGYAFQGLQTVAVGLNAGSNTQSNLAVAIGVSAGSNTQGDAAVAIGASAGFDAQGNQAVAIGTGAGETSQGTYAVAIGSGAGANAQGNNSIILNATGANLNQTVTNTFTVAPVRNDTSNIAEVMFYNATSKEVTYGNTISIAGNANVGNLGTGRVIATGNISGTQLISNIAIGTAPLVVTSTTRVANLSVDYANVSDFITVAAGTGNNFLVFANAATGNVSEVTSTGITANLSNNSITATTFVGALANGNSNVNIPSANGNVNISAVGNANIVVVTGTGANVTGTLNVTGNITGNTNGFAIGYLNIPQVSAANATLALTDAGKHYYSTTAGNLTLTIPTNANVAFATGTAISVVVQAAGNVLVNAASGVTLYMGGNSTAGNRVISTYGMATLMKVATNTWFINGTGVA